MKKNLHISIVLGSAILGFLIILYYWQNTTLISLQEPPIYLMVFAMSYILLQILKRYAFSGQNWWDWLYYIGLFSMLLALFFAQESSLVFFSWFTQIGTFFFLVPLFFDFKSIVSKS